ncbi:MAG: tyrosine-type recombinase/integrase [Planctomycetota bacterium]
MGGKLKDRPKHDYLFVSKSGHQIDQSAVRDVVIKYSAPLKLKKPVTCHTFRRSCATEMVKRNANLMHVKEILGHENLEATKVYCRLTITDLKKTHQKYHPREKDKSNYL